MKRKIVGVFVITLLIASATLSALGDKNNEFKSSNENLSSDDWLVMVYLDGDNDLDPCALLDLGEMKEKRPTAGNVHLTCIHDSIVTNEVKYYHWYKNEPEDVYTYSEKDMRNPDTLEDFISWSLNNYRQDNSMLILWDHGCGWQGCCNDDSSGDGIMTVHGIVTALDNVGHYFDIIALQACYCACVELCYELRNFADYFIGSEITTKLKFGPSVGSHFDFHHLITSLSNDCDLPTKTICHNFVDKMFGSCITHDSQRSHTWSVINLNKMDDVIRDLDSFANKLMDCMLTSDAGKVIHARATTEEYIDDPSGPVCTDGWCIDLQHFAERIVDEGLDLGANQLISTLRSAICDNYVHKGDETVDHANGLNIYFESDPSSLSYNYIGGWLDNFDNHKWDDFLWFYHDDCLVVDDDFDSSVHDWQNTRFDKIQDAINKANKDDIIYVMDGYYTENIVIDKEISLIGLKGDAAKKPEITSDVDDPLITILSDNVALEGFRITGRDWQHGIYLQDADNCELMNNNIKTCHNGINLINSDNCRIIQSNIRSNKGNGIYSKDSSGLNIIGNEIEGNTVSGISLIRTESNNIASNSIKNNQKGISLSESYFDTNITNNNISENDYGIWLTNSNDNLIYDNYFDNTEKNAIDNGNNEWNIDPPEYNLNPGNIIGWPYIAGNYWSDYLGWEMPYPWSKLDGIGDTLIPHKSSGGILNGGDFAPLLRTLVSDGADSPVLSEPGIILLDKPLEVGLPDVFAEIINMPIVIGPITLELVYDPYLIDVIEKCVIVIDGEPWREFSTIIDNKISAQWNEFVLMKQVTISFETYDYSGTKMVNQYNIFKMI